MLWQYAIPYFDDSIKIPSDYLNEFLDGKPATEIIFKPFLEDTVSGFKYYRGFYDYVLQGTEAHIYLPGWYVELPLTLAEYTFAVHIDYWNVTNTEWTFLNNTAYRVNGYAGYVNHYFYSAIELYPNHNYRFIISFYDSLGNAGYVNTDYIDDYPYSTYPLSYVWTTGLNAHGGTGSDTPWFTSGIYYP